MEPSTNNSSSIAIPAAIIFGFALIAVAIYYTGTGSSLSPTNESVTTISKEANTIRPVDETDYIRGNPNAPILIVEYSDYDCPFCKTFHTTMNQIMNEYAVDGKIAWVYRQYPIPELHPNAPRISESALCVGDLGGNDAFWKFTDQVFEERRLEEGTNISKIPDYAKEAGVDEAAFKNCLETGKMRDVLAASLKDGAQAKIEGTPNSFVIIGNQRAPIEGAQPYDVIKQIVENLLGQLEGSGPTASTTPQV